MGRNKSLSPTVRAQIVALKQTGFTERQLANRFGCSKTAVHQAITRYEEQQTFSDRKRAGRPRVTSLRDDMIIRRLVVKSPSSSIRKIRSTLLSHEVNVSSMTVSRRLSKDFNLKSFKPAAKPKLTPTMKKKRLDFAKRHVSWSVEQWSRVLFSDESTVRQFNSRKTHVRRPPGERFNDRYTVMTMKHPPSQMIWGAMSVHGTAGLFFLEKNTTMNGDKYLQLLKDKLELHMGVHNCSIFMHDGAPCHTSKKVKTYLADTGVRVLDWPGNSPDLNPIENLWTLLKNKVAEKQPSSAPDMIAAIKSVWVSEITPDYCKKLIHSMPRRLEAVIKNGGGHTKY